MAGRRTDTATRFDECDRQIGVGDGAHVAGVERIGTRTAARGDDGNLHERVTTLHAEGVAGAAGIARHAVESESDPRLGDGGGLSGRQNDLAGNRRGSGRRLVRTRCHRQKTKDNRGDSHIPARCRRRTSRASSRRTRLSRSKLRRLIFLCSLSAILSFVCVSASPPKPSRDGSQLAVPGRLSFLGLPPEPEIRIPTRTQPEPEIRTPTPNQPRPRALPALVRLKCRCRLPYDRSQ